MDSRIVQRLFKGFGASLYGQAVVVVIQLAGVPILLSQWHAALYGEWLILFAIPAYLSLGDLGFSLSAANDMTARVGREDRAEDTRGHPYGGKWGRAAHTVTLSKI